MKGTKHPKKGNEENRKRKCRFQGGGRRPKLKKRQEKYNQFVKLARSRDRRLWDGSGDFKPVKRKNARIEGIKVTHKERTTSRGHDTNEVETLRKADTDNIKEHRKTQ